MKRKPKVPEIPVPYGPHRQVIYVPDLLGGGQVQCPRCGHTDEMDGFDCLGADLDGDCNSSVFCNQCHEELEL